MRSRSQRGMTLIETLVAMVILSMAVVAAISLTRTAEKLNAAAQRRQQQADDAFGRAFVRAQIEGIAPVVVVDGSGTPSVKFNGSANEIDFYATCLTTAELPALHHASIRIVDGAVFLVNDADRETPETPSRRLFALEGDGAFRFGEISSDGTLVIHDDWVNRRRLPDIVMLQQKRSATNAAETILSAAPRLSSTF